MSKKKSKYKPYVFHLLKKTMKQETIQQLNKTPHLISNLIPKLVFHLHIPQLSATTYLHAVFLQL